MTDRLRDKLKQSESWKRTWWLGAVGASAIILRFVGWGHEPGGEMVAFVLGCLGIAGGWQGLKRATWSHDAASFANGSNAQRRREQDEHGAEFAG